MYAASDIHSSLNNDAAGRAIAQAVSRWIPTAAVRLRAEVR
jgi:hypothetical protein